MLDISTRPIPVQNGTPSLLGSVAVACPPNPAILHPYPSDRNSSDAPGWEMPLVHHWAALTLEDVGCAR